MFGYNVAVAMMDWVKSVGWDITTLNIDNGFQTIAESVAPVSISLSPDGTKVYVFDNGSYNLVQYSLSPAYDIASATYVQKKAFNSSPGGVSSCIISPNGLYLYTTSYGANALLQYTLSTAWDISTATYTGDFSTTSQANVGDNASMYIRSDGNAVYFLDGSTYVWEYTLGTSWEISSAVYASTKISVSGHANEPYGIYFKPDGSQMYIASNGNNKIYQYSLSTNWDIATATYTAASGSLSAGEPNVFGIYIKSDGTQLYSSAGLTTSSVLQGSMT